MKLAITATETFPQIARHLARLVDRRMHIPITSQVLISARKAGVTLSVTDLDAELTIEIPANVGKEGRATLAADALARIADRLDGDLNIAADADDKVDLTTGGANYSIQGLPPRDFPSFSMPQAKSSFRMEAATLHRMLTTVSHAISTEETRYYLNGIYLHTFSGDAGRKLRAVATDGHRLAFIEIDAPQAIPDITGIIIPRGAIRQLSELLNGVGGEITISLSDLKMCLEWPGFALFTKLIDGTFPPYQKVIPVGNGNALEIDAGHLIATANRVAAISNRQPMVLRLDLGVTCEISTTSDGDTAKQELDCSYAGTPIAIGFNHRYLLQVLEPNSARRMKCLMGDPSTPVILTAEGAEGVTWVLMPMRV